ncbi:MAG: EAL domain-containing protein [Aestuariibacter sp.]
MTKEVSESNHATVLVVDDEPISLTAISHALEEEDYQVLQAQHGEEALNIATEQNPDVMLLDINMPGMNGLDVCKLLKASPETEAIPIIFLTASQNDLAEAFNAGAVDYVLKPFNVTEVLARVNVHARNARLMESIANTNKALAALTNSLEMKVKERTNELTLANEKLRAEINEKQELREQLQQLSKYDVVTGMHNRLAMQEFIDIKLLESQMLPEFPLFYMFLDVDQLKVINDSFGHDAGDKLILDLVSIFKGMAREEDVVARMGGDEFSMIFSESDVTHAKVRAEKLREKLKQAGFQWENNPLNIDVSIGLVELTADFQDANHVMGVAEKLTYESKIRGGGELLIYENVKDLVQSNSKEIRWVPAIQHALEHNNFVLFGQGIFPLDGGRPERYEVLVRMQTDDGLVLPPLFVPIAERFHLISQIDKWVFNETFQMLLEHPNTDFKLAINVSGESLHKDSYLEYISGRLCDAPQLGQRLCFEINETAALTNIDATENFIEKIGQFGCEFALDDFGTGTSSYGFLKSLNVQFVKIDGSFIQHIENEKISRMMVTSIYSLAKENNMQVVAEAVETESILQTLQNIRVDYAQGYALQEPQELISLLS